MRIGFLTNEYPPHVYGGAGVHLEYLSHEIAQLDDKQHEVKILCFGRQEEESENLTVREDVRLHHDLFSGRSLDAEPSAVYLRSHAFDDGPLSSVGDSFER